MALDGVDMTLSVGGMRPATAHAVHAVLMEVDSQRDKWGEQNHNAAKWLQILVEEIGEVAKAMLDGSLSDQENEITHVAAVAVSWLDCVNRNAGH